MGKKRGIFTVFVMLFAVAAMACQHHALAGDDEPIPGAAHYVYENPEKDIRIIFQDPFVDIGDNNSAVLCGPNTDWPFLGGYRFILTFEAPLAPDEYDEICDHQIEMTCEFRSHFQIADKEVFHTKEQRIYAECPAMKYIVFGPRFNYVFAYPDCGGSVNHEFQQASDDYIKQVIANIRFLDAAEEDDASGDAKE